MNAPQVRELGFMCRRVQGTEFILEQIEFPQYGEMRRSAQIYCINPETVGLRIADYLVAEELNLRDADGDTNRHIAVEEERSL